MKARILDGVGVALVLASMAVAASVTPKPMVPVYSICNDDSIPWWAKLDCIWSN